MNTKHLQYLREIARVGSINQAAANLYISQPSLSGIVKSVEKEVGYPLFQTRSTGTTPTPAGLLFLRSVGRILDEVDRIMAIPETFKTHESLSVCMTFSRRLMHIYLQLDDGEARLQRDRDKIKETGLHHALHDALTNVYRLTFVYVFNHRVAVHRAALETYGYVMERLTHAVPLDVLMPCQHRLVRTQMVTPTQLARERIVSFEDFSFDDWLGALGVATRATSQALNVLYVFDRASLTDAIVEGGYVAAVPRGFCDAREGRGLKMRPLVDVPHTLSWYVVRARDRRMNARERAFIDAVRGYDRTSL